MYTGLVILFFLLSSLFLFKYLRSFSPNLFALLLTSILINLVFLSLLTLLIYYINLYSPLNFLMFLSVVSLILIALLVRKLRENRLPRKLFLRSKILDRYDLAFILILLFVNIVTANISYFGILTDTDSFNYLNEGLTMGKSLSNSSSNYPFELSSKIISSIPLFPLWISLFNAMFGTSSIFYINTFFSTIALSAFYLFLCQHLSKKIALLSVFCLGLNLSWLLTAKILLREIAAVCFIFTWLMFIRRNNYFRFISPFMLFLILQIRPELIIFVPVLILLIWFKKIQPRNYIAGYCGSTGLFLLMSVKVDPGRYVSSAFLSSIVSKWLSLVSQNFPIILITFFVTTISIFLSLKIKEKMTINKSSLLVLLFLILFLFSVFIRPMRFNNQYKQTFDVNKIITTDIVNFDDISMIRVGYFIPLVEIFLAILGFNLYLQHSRKSRELLVFSSLWLLMSVIFFINPSHEPNIRVWIRRFIPVVIPGIITFFSYWMINANIARISKITILSLVLILNLAISLPTAMYQEYKDLYIQLVDFAKRFKSDDVLVFHYPKGIISDYKISGILRVLFNKNTYTTDTLQEEFQDLYLLTFNQVEVGSSCTLLVQERLTSTRLAWEFFTIPNKLTTTIIPLNLYKCL